MTGIVLKSAEPYPAISHHVLCDSNRANAQITSDNESSINLCSSKFLFECTEWKPHKVLLRQEIGCSTLSKTDIHRKVDEKEKKTVQETHERGRRLTSALSYSMQED